MAMAASPNPTFLYLFLFLPTTFFMPEYQKSLHANKLQACYEEEKKKKIQKEGLEDLAMIKLLIFYIHPLQSLSVPLILIFQ